MPKKIKVGAAVLADYVGQGAANKITIVNAFSGDVILPEMPCEVSFGLYIELRFDNVPSSIDFELLLNGKRLAHGKAAGPPQAFANEATVIVIPLFPVKVTEDSKLEAFVSAAGYSRTLALAKKLFKGALPTA